MNFTLQRVRLDSQGYANGGRHYYGIGLPLWWAMSEDGSADMHFRAPTREAAKFVIRVEFPGATFYR
jgi:hypothetical protein